MSSASSELARPPEPGGGEGGRRGGGWRAQEGLIKINQAIIYNY